MSAEFDEALDAVIDAGLVKVIEPTAIEPSRVLVLNEDEQRELLQALPLVDDHPSSGPGRLWERLAYSDEYANPTDELARVTLRKRRLEAEVRRCNITIARVEEQVCEELMAAGHRKVTHAATGATLALDSKVWAKLDVDTSDMSKEEADAVRADRKAAAGDMLIEVGLGDYVRNDFNMNSISAYFRQQIKDYNAEQAELPEHQRQPRTAQSFLPAELDGYLIIDDTPHITVRGG
jgi:hypothetical protein